MCLKTDYMRMKCFEFAVKEIRRRNVPGDVAEVGVFWGNFVKFINAMFTDRICYLCNILTWRRLWIKQIVILGYVVIYYI